MIDLEDTVLETPDIILRKALRDTVVEEMSRDEKVAILKSTFAAMRNLMDTLLPRDEVSNKALAALGAARMFCMCSLKGDK